MKHGLLVLLLLPFGYLSVVAQTPGKANEMQSKHSFSEAGKDESFPGNSRQVVGVEKFPFSAINHVIFNIENIDNDKVESFEYNLFKENVQFKTTFL